MVSKTLSAKWSTVPSLTRTSSPIMIQLPFVACANQNVAPVTIVINAQPARLQLYSIWIRMDSANLTALMEPISIAITLSVCLASQDAKTVYLTLSVVSVWWVLLLLTNMESSSCKTGSISHNAWGAPQTVTPAT